jgi:2-polyprenyl-6-methoxyphenol hydroxylase-like FAD-dependent oxidoreductase
LIAKEAAQSLGGEALKRIAQTKASGWHADLRNLIAKSDPATVSCLPIRTSVPVAPWPTKRITLLGDAIHSMTPFRGIGANIALRDAANLCHALSAANAGETELLPAIQAYESEMIRYGFRAVRDSFKAMEQILDDRAVRRTISRASFKMLQSLPPRVKDWVFRRMGED